MKARENIIKKSKTRGDKKQLRIHIHIKDWAWENQRKEKRGMLVEKERN